MLHNSVCTPQRIMQLPTQALQSPLHIAPCELCLAGRSLRRSDRRAYRHQSTAAAQSSKGFGKPKSKSKSADRKEAWSFQQLMLAWDDTFQATSEEPERAAEVFEIARHGHSAHGRGCVYIKAKLTSCFKSGGRGAKAARQRFTAQPSAGEALSTNPDLLLEDWSAFYVPGPLLQTLGGLFTANDDVDLPDGSGLMTSPTASTPKQDYGLSSAALSELQRTMRGMDAARLLTITGLLPRGAEGSGEEAYDPGGDQAVLLLAVKVDGRPSVGADMVDCQLLDDGSVRLSTPGLEGLL